METTDREEEKETKDQEKEMLTNNYCQRDDFLINREKEKQEME
jgi:hypothetical protein